MLTKTITVKATDFFHARPAAQVAAAAKGFESVVLVMLGSETADAKNPLALMRLSHPQGKAFDLLADGPDEKEALHGVAFAIERAFGGD